jgi:ABC-2 type transport system ATP-binding protein
LAAQPTVAESSTNGSYTPANDLGAFGGQPAVEIRGVRKAFGNVVALDRLDLTIPKAAVGLLGANGAGKTTLLRILLGLTNPTQGAANVLGYDTRTQGVKVREMVGYMPESDCLPMSTTAADFVGHMAEMSGLPATAARQRAADVLYQVGLDEERYRLIKGFSTGMKQRVKLAQALVHDPGLVFLDEPTNGMDPQGRDDMLDLIKRIHRMLGIAVIVSSHILEDIERVCDYVIILSGGKLMLAQPLEGIGIEQGDLLVRIDERQQEFIRRLEGLGLTASIGSSDELHGSEEIVVRFDNEEVYDVVRDVTADMGVALRSLRKRARSLEDVYIGELQGAATGGPDGSA